MHTLETSAADFEQALSRELGRFTTERKSSGRKRAPRTNTRIARPDGLVVTIVVRKKRLGMDEVYVHRTSTLSVLEATLEAQKAARAAGWPIFGRTQSVEKIEVES